MKNIYALICEKVKEIPGSPYRLIDQIMDAASSSFRRNSALATKTNSISSNIAEDYCRRSLKEYLYFLNIALGSSGEVYSRCYACFRAGQFSEKTFDEIDTLHYEAENNLLRLIESLQGKPIEEWSDSFLREDSAEYLYSEEELEWKECQ